MRARRADSLRQRQETSREMHRMSSRRGRGQMWSTKKNRSGYGRTDLRSRVKTRLRPGLLTDDNLTPGRVGRDGGPSGRFPQRRLNVPSSPARVMELDGDVGLAEDAEGRREIAGWPEEFLDEEVHVVPVPSRTRIDGRSEDSRLARETTRESRQTVGVGDEEEEGEALTPGRRSAGSSARAVHRPSEKRVSEQEMIR